MTGGDGDVPPPDPLHARTLISGFSAVPGSASGSDVRRSMKWGKEMALAGDSSAATMGSPLPPSKSLTDREVEAGGGKKKRKKTDLHASGVHRCSLCEKSFKSRNAVHGHMRVHKNRSQWRNEPPKQQVHEEQDEELPSILLKLGQRTLNKMEGSETKGNSSAMAEGGASSLLAEAQRKKTHMKLDLNKDAPEDEENDDEDCGDDGWST